MLFCLAAAAATVSAADPPVHVQYVPPPISLDAPAKDQFWERFKNEFTSTAEETFARRFHPFKLMRWNTDVGDHRFGKFSDWSTETARQTFAECVTRGTREAAVDLPLMVWLEERQGLLADFLKNSVGNVEEEEMDPMSLSSTPVKRSWWSRSEGNDIYCGIRPFRTDPYAFFTVTMKEGESLLLLTNLRYHFKNFSEHRFELALSMPLDHGFSIEIGTSYEFSHNGHEGKVAVKAFKEFRNGSLLLVGLDVRDTPGAFAGLSIPL
jgi:hypothetical protein